MNIQANNILKEVLVSEGNSLIEASRKINEIQSQKLEKLFEYLLVTGGKLIVSGVGKSGLVATKISATFASLGLPSIFLHPTEAVHGDLGRVQKNDAIIFLSNSGTTEELVNLIPYLPINKEFRIALVGKTKSVIADKCDIVFDCSVEKESSLNEMAPTNSSTLAMAMGDAMAILFEAVSGLTKEGFARNHPAGLLGKSLSLKVCDVMTSVSECPVVKPSDTLKTVLIKMTEKPIGLCAVIEGNEIKGIIVEGDIRRTLTDDNNSLETTADKVMIKDPSTIKEDDLAFDALKLMEKRSKPISVLPVLKKSEFLGVVRLHDLLKVGFQSNS